jgi:hypothetical protein
MLRTRFHRQAALQRSQRERRRPRQRRDHPRGKREEAHIDFGGLTYDVGGSLVGSAGNRSQSLHFEKDATSRDNVT